MQGILLKRIILLFTLLLTAVYTNAKTVQATADKKVQACVLYGTNQNSGYPIPKLQCIEVRRGIKCDEKVVDSKISHKIWRSYPRLDCSAPNIKAGLSERYLLEGVD